MSHSLGVSPISGNTTITSAVDAPPAPRRAEEVLGRRGRWQGWRVRVIGALLVAPVAFVAYRLLAESSAGIPRQALLVLAAVLTGLIAASYLPLDGTWPRMPGYAAIAGFYVFLAGYVLAAGPLTATRAGFVLVALTLGLALRVRGSAAYAG